MRSRHLVRLGGLEHPDAVLGRGSGCHAGGARNQGQLSLWVISRVVMEVW